MTIHSKSKYLCIQRTNLFLEYYTHTQWLLLLLFEHYRIIAKNKNNCRQQWSVSSQLNTSNQWNPGDWWKQWADGNIISCPQPQGDKAGQQVHRMDSENRITLINTQRKAKDILEAIPTHLRYFSRRWDCSCSFAIASYIYLNLVGGKILFPQSMAGSLSKFGSLNILFLTNCSSIFSEDQ